MSLNKLKYKYNILIIYNKQSFNLYLVQYEKFIKENIKMIKIGLIIEKKRICIIEKNMIN